MEERMLKSSKGETQIDRETLLGNQKAQEHIEQIINDKDM